MDDPNNRCTLTVGHKRSVPGYSFFLFTGQVQQMPFMVLILQEMNSKSVSALIKTHQVVQIELHAVGLIIWLIRFSMAACSFLAQLILCGQRV